MLQGECGIIPPYSHDNAVGGGLYAMTEMDRKLAKAARECSAEAFLRRETLENCKNSASLRRLEVIIMVKYTATGVCISLVKVVNMCRIISQSLLSS